MPVPPFAGMPGAVPFVRPRPSTPMELPTAPPAPAETRGCGSREPRGAAGRTSQDAPRPTAHLLLLLTIARGWDERVSALLDASTRVLPAWGGDADSP